MAEISNMFSSGFFSNSLVAAVDIGKNIVQPATMVGVVKTITLEEVSWHDHAKDCWIIIYDRVYDITDFLDEHPGGSDILLEYAGREASVAFRGSGHSPQAIRALEKFYIGELPMHERIFRKPGGYKLSDIPQ